ncbi:MAG: Mpo1-like protein [Burkholderiales bacterium]|nr:Mpo1-like protein [Burkholderiales bacterium]
MTAAADSTSTASPAHARRVDQLLAHYGESHRHPGNEAIHMVAIPLIMLSLCGLLFAVHPWVAYAFIGASMVYYARLSGVFLASMAVASALILAAVHAMGEHVLALSAAVFVGAWIAQFVGHKMEGRKPSFFEDLQYLWVGPLFVLSRIFGRLGVRW